MTPPAPDVHPNPRLSAITRPTPTKERQLRSHLEPLVPRRIADEAFLEYEVSVGERLTRTVPYMPYDDIMITIEEPWHLTTTHRHPVALIGTLTQPLKLFRQWREWFNQILADPSLLPVRIWQRGMRRISWTAGPPPRPGSGTFTSLSGVNVGLESLNLRATVGICVLFLNHSSRLSQATHLGHGIEHSSASGFQV